jgi:hypothetical protein
MQADAQVLQHALVDGDGRSLGGVMRPWSASSVHEVPKPAARASHSTICRSRSPRGFP